MNAERKLRVADVRPQLWRMKGELQTQRAIELAILALILLSIGSMGAPFAVDYLLPAAERAQYQHYAMWVFWSVPAFAIIIAILFWIRKDKMIWFYCPNYSCPSAAQSGVQGINATYWQCQICTRIHQSIVKKRL
jgi:hypothetical protein